MIVVFSCPFCEIVVVVVNFLDSAYEIAVEGVFF